MFSSDRKVEEQVLVLFSLNAKFKIFQVSLSLRLYVSNFRALRLSVVSRNDDPHLLHLLKNPIVSKNILIALPIVNLKHISIFISFYSFGQLPIELKIWLKEKGGWIEGYIE